MGYTSHAKIGSMTRRAISKTQLKPLIALTRNICAMHDHDPSCAGYNLVRNDKFLGEIAHIAAAEEDGKRYDEEMDDDQRNSNANLVVLCPNHHTIIDNDDVTYTTELLLEIKRAHEEASGSDSFEPSEDALAEAEKRVDTYIINGNANTGDGMQHVSTVTGSGSQASISAGHDVINNYYGMSAPPLAATSGQLTTGFRQLEQSLVMAAEVTSLSLSAHESSSAVYLRFSIGSKRFVVLAQVLADQTAGVGRDGMGKYNMEASSIVVLLAKAQLITGNGLQDHTLLAEFQALSHTKSLNLLITTISADIRLIPFEKLDEITTQCANPIRLMFNEVVS